MGPADHVDITGAKGGSSKPKSPVEAPDSLQSTNIGKILIAVGEGEFDEEPTDRDIYFDNTPIMDASGSVNFPGVRWEWRSGSVEQDYIQGIPAIENETTVNVELRSDNPFARALSNTQLSAVRVRMVWPRLAQQDSSGNTNGYRIEYAIDIATDGGAYVEAHLGAVDGKTTNGYQRSVRVNLPKATSGWMLRVRRITPNANSGTVADTMTIAGYTEIIDQKLRYPNTALLYIEFDAQQFQNIPAVTVKCKAKRWPVPTNYDPVARTYTGVWDGTFKQAWTNNPAFVTYGVCVEDRFGLGKRIKPWMVDKWEMYRIAQYCDQLVPNGQGGQEPRFLCDMNLQGRAEAWTLLRDLSGIYRGMVYWAHGSLFMQADMPRAQDIDYVFTRANVIDGEFVYGGAERNTHYSRALVSYDNPANNYDTDVIPVTDNALQRRYRDRPVEISAIGCTRASEAQRRGKWALLSNSQDRTVTFKTGMEGRIPLPGYVIPVADELVAGRPNGGRISAAAGRVVTLDRDTPIKAGDRLILNLPNGTAQARTVQSVVGRAVTVTTAYGVQPEPELQWAIDYHDLAVQLFRVLKTTRTQEGEYEITALEFNPSKFAAIDTGAKLDERPISVIPVATVQPPASVTLSSTHMIDQGIAVSTMTIVWPAVDGAVAYDVEWRKDNGNWVSMQRTGAASVDVVGIYAGAYLARVRAVSAFDITSVWKSSVLTQLSGKEGQPPSVTYLEAESLLFGIGIKWGFPAGAEDTQRTELWYSEGADLSLTTKLADLAYPQNEYVMQGLSAGQRFYFWARLVDRSGNIGPFYPVEGTYVTGAASADAGPILEQIAGEILESHLGQQLTEKIDLIDGNGPGSVNERVEAARSDLSEQVSEVNNAVAAVHNSVTAVRDNLQQQVNAVGQEVGAAKADLQQKIDSVSVLAGSLPYNKDKTYTTNQGVLGADGKLYQALKAVPKNTPPPNATYWTDVGQAIVTAAGTASRVSKVETDVSTLDGKATAQATQIGGLQSSLTTTNQNVTTAQQAADAANTLAGGKGKVIIQAAAPAAADRLAQNLWIDTTNNANTPKRWNGTTWLAVTDKAATDAAAAAQSALSQVALKADATVVNNVATRVSEAEGKLSSQASRMDGMQTSIDGKASSQSLQQVSNRVTATEQKDAAQDLQLTSQSQVLTSLTDSVSKKAEASTVQALSNEVNQHGQDLSAQRQSLTKINAALPLVGGENLVYNPSFDTPDPTTPLVADGWWYDSASAPVTRVPSLVVSTLAPGFAQRLDVAGLTSSTWARVYGRANRRFKVVPGKTYTASVYMRGTAGLRILPQVYGVSDAGVSSNSWAGVRVDASDTWARLSVTFTADANTAQIYPAFVVYGGASASAGFIEGDQYQIEEGALATGWRDNGQVNSGNQASTATAVEALNAKVTQQGTDLASTSSKTTSLENSLNTTNGNVTAAQAAAQNAAALAGSKGKVIVQAAAPDVADRVAQNLWIDTTGNANTPKRWNGTTWQVVTDKVATDAAAAAQSALSQVALKADASALQTLGSTVSQQGQQITANGQALISINANLAQSLDNNPAKIYQSVFSDASLDKWISTNSGAGASASFSNVAGNTSGATLTLSGGANNASWWGASTRKIRFDPERLYKLTVRIQQLTPGNGSPVTYAGLDGFAEDGVTRLNNLGNVGIGSSHYVVINGRPQPVGEWVTHTAYVKGHTVGSEGGGAGAGTLADPKRMKSGVAWVSPMMIAGYSGIGGELAVDFFTIEDVTEQAQIDNNALATSALTGRVSLTEQGLTSASNQLTELNNSIGDVGGENLVYNSSFEEEDPGTPGIGNGWWYDGSAGTRAPSLVPSTVAPGIAQRLDIAGLSPSTWARVYVKQSMRFKVTPGKTYTASVYVRGTPGLRVLAQVYNLNAAGSNTASWGSVRQDATLEWARLVVTFVATSDTVLLYPSIVVYGGASVTGGFIEADQYQVEQGTRASGWRDNRLVNAAINSATSKAVDNLTSVVNQQGGTLSSVTGRTTTLENSLTTTNQNVTSAQQAADAANTLAGGKGKVIIQASAPAAADRLAQNLWIDTTNNANTPKRWSGSAWVAVTDKAATDAAAAAANALSVAQGKADASVVQGINSRVTDAEGKLTSQGQAITAMDNSLTVTNQNATTAQQAAQAAADSAGTKGKVLYQSAAPAVADRLGQNLWIDTTNNANTPKRWSGSAWVAVTDKAATDAAAAAQSALTQVATKAEASALQTLTNRVAAAEGVNTSQSASLIDLSNNVGAIQSGLGASGLDPAPGAYWQFDAGAEGLVGVNANTAVSGGSLRLTPTSTNPQLLTSSGALTLSIPGAQYTKVRVGLTRRGGAATSWTGTLYYSTTTHSILSAYRASAANPNIAVGQSAVVEWDMANLAVGGTDWLDSTIGRLRFDFANSLDSVWDVDWIAVGRVGPSASSRVVESLTSTVTQQGDKLTAEAQRIDGLYTSVGSAQAAIQNEITARTNADSALSQQIQTTQSSLGDTNASVQRVSSTLTQLNGVANASEVVKVQMTANGIRHVAGFGLSIDNSKGAVQSTFAILAGRFAILNPSGDAISSPFAVYGNQTFISDAYIRDASITNAKIANAAITAAKIGEAEVDTLRIRGNAVTIPVGAFASASSVSVTVTLDGNYPVFLLGSLTQTYYSDISMTRNGVALWVERPQGSSIASRGVMDYPGPGTHTYTLSSNHAGNTNGASILAVVCKR